MLHKLIFDTTDANTIADSHSVGAYIRSSDGTLITHTTVGGKEALDVRVAEGINVEVDLDAGDDSVAAWLSDGSGNAIGSTAGSLDVNLTNTSIAVTATDLDIRDLAFATDSVDVSGSEVSLNAATLAALETITVEQGTDPWVIGDGGGSITVDASQLDIDDLNATDDAVQAWAFDGTGNAIGSTSNALDVYIVGSDPITVNDAALANTAIATASNTLGVAATAEDVVASPLANRKYLWLYNNDNRDMYIGASGVSAATGFPVPPGSLVSMRAGAAIDIEWVSAKVGHDLRSMELS